MKKQQKKSPKSNIQANRLISSNLIILQNIKIGKEITDIL